MKWLRAISVVALVVAWELLGIAGLIDRQFLSIPSAMLKAGVKLMVSGELWANSWISLEELLLGFSIALVLGIMLGMAIGWSDVFSELVDPLLTTIYCLPRTSLMPLIIIWLGIGMNSKAAIVFLGAIFPIMVNTTVGMRSADPSWIRAARSFGAEEWQVFHKILLPCSVPYIMGGIRLGLGRGILGVIIGEMYVATKGIGHQIMLYQVGLNTDYLFFLIFLTAFAGVFLVALARVLESRLSRWHEESRA